MGFILWLCICFTSCLSIVFFGVWLVGLWWFWGFLGVWGFFGKMVVDPHILNCYLQQAEESIWSVEVSLFVLLCVLLFFPSLLFKVYDAAVRWLKYDEPNRQPYMVDILAKVRFPLISKNFLSKTVQAEPLIQDNPECLKMVISKLTSG